MRAVLLDRDGVLVRERGYITRAGELEVLPGVPGALSALRRAGVLLVVATNQAAVARGLLEEPDLAVLHRTLDERLRTLDPGAFWDALYYCPHHPTEGRDPYRKACDCRKPGPGMLLRASRELGFALADAWMVGDAARDVGAGRAAGCRTLALPGPDGRFPEGADACAPDLAAAVPRLLGAG